MGKRKTVGAIMASAIAVCGSAQAGEIVVENHSFEDVILADGDWQPGSFAGWDVVTGPVGVWNPYIGFYPDGIPDGQNVAYANGGYLTQTVNAAFVEGQKYTLLVDVGLRIDMIDPNFTIQILGDNVVVAANNGFGIPEPGAWTTIETSFVVTESDPAVGHAVEIQLGGNTATQVNFDNVRLYANPIPGPASVALLALAGAAVRRRRR